MKRRTFIKTGSVLSASSLLPFSGETRTVSESLGEPQLLPKRPLGETGEYLSILGFGGIVVKDAEQEVANKVVKDAVKAGVNYFDVAPLYGDAEVKLGPALEPYRKNVFLACKSRKRTAKELNEELHQSLERLRTDYFDLYQLHVLITAEDITTAFGKDGALRAILDAREKGLVRYIGFSAHTVESAIEALKSFQFDTMLVPINFVAWYQSNFGPQLVEYARDRGTAILALKSLVFGTLPENAPRPCPKCWYQPITKEDEMLLALRFTLSQPVTSALPPGDETLYRTALKLAPSFIPISETEEEKLTDLAMNTRPLFRYPSEEFKLVK
jgi:predicted aldo/keto reductase-like oxidoreductase